MNNRLILIILFCFSGTTALSQELNLFLQEIKEERFKGKTHRSRSDSISKIMFTTAVNGIALDDYHLVKLGELKVTDNTGKPLKEIKGTFYKNHIYTKAKRFEIIVEASARQVTKIKTFEGSLLYFTPTESNNGKLIIRNFFNQKNKNLLAERYPEIELRLLDTDKLIDLQEKTQKMIDEEVEKRKKEDPISDAELQEIKKTRQLLSDITRLNDNRATHNRLTFQSNKPLNEAFFRFSIFNENDEKINTGYTSVNNIYQIYLKEQPTKNCYIEILIESEKAIKELPFQFNNIVLP